MGIFWFFVKESIQTSLLQVRIGPRLHITHGVHFNDKKIIKLIHQGIILIRSARIWQLHYIPRMYNNLPQHIQTTQSMSIFRTFIQNSFFVQL